MKRTSTRDPFETILRFAGRREPVNPARAERVERHARACWQSMVSRRRAVHRRRWAAWAGGGVAIAAGIIAAVAMLPRPAPQAPIVATVVKIIGAPAGGARGHTMADLAHGRALSAGSVVETSAGQGVALELVSGHSLRLAEGTRVRVEDQAVTLDAGAVYLDSGSNGRASPIELRSHVATVRELGTQYMVRLSDDSLAVSVREGAVSVARGDVTEAARAGEMLELDESGRLERKAIRDYGARWAWAAALAPAPDLENLTLAEFLRWLAREQGWRLIYASADLEREAAAAELHGSLEGLSGEEALAAVMTATGWRYRLADGALYIDAR